MHATLSRFADAAGGYLHSGQLVRVTLCVVWATRGAKSVAHMTSLVFEQSVGRVCVYCMVQCRLLAFGQIVHLID